MREDSRNILVGVGTLVALAVLGSATFGGKSIGSVASGYVVRASFSKVDGLNPGDAVRLSGIKIGEVGGMRLGPNYSAIVDLRIDMPIELPTDTSAAIHTDGLFGQKHVVLVPGADDKVLKTGSSINLTQDSVLVGDLLDLIIGEGRAKLKKAGAAPSTEAAPTKPGELMAPLLSDPAEPK
jgi:phospholipid/cholesterol/gamma-HCH transport system substrate-binding protein